MKIYALHICITIVTAIVTTQAFSECIAIGFPEDQIPKNPIYKILSCSHASSVVDQLRKNDPNWYGEISYTSTDSALRITYSNEDARRLMGQEFRYWYYPLGCGSFEDGQTLLSVELEEKCCDVGPVRDVQCGLGGIKLTNFQM